jgi:hypothetical protein
VGPLPSQLFHRIFSFFSFDQRTGQDRRKPPFNASKTTKINAELGTLLATVIPHPRYNPLTPYALQIALPSSQNLTWGAVEFAATVCIRDLIVSAGKKRKL